MKNLNKILISLILILFLFLGFYYTKCQLGFNIFEELSISRYFPFTFLQRDTDRVVSNPRDGVLFVDDFDPVWLSLRHWCGFWAKEKELVEKKYVAEGMDDSNCLLIVNEGKRSWAYSHAKMIEVIEGDRFSLKASVRVDGDDVGVGLGVTSYDEDMKVVKWNDGYKKVSGARSWKGVENVYVVPEGVRFIRFRLSGAGEGKVWVDGVGFLKL